MKRCFLIGCGSGQEACLSLAAREAVSSAPLVTGARRLLSAFEKLIPEKARTAAVYEPSAVLAVLEEFAADPAGDGSPVCLFSGDTGFFSGAAAVLTALEEQGWECREIPGISSVQAFSARIGRPWQDWQLLSAHGTDRDIGALLSRGERLFLLTGGSITLSSLAAYLASHGGEEACLTVGSRLGAPDERIWRGRAADYSPAYADESLSCVLVERSLPRPPLPKGALPDSFFTRREQIPMTKRFVRAAVLSLLPLADETLVWDIGCGSGAVTVELARSAFCHVYAVDVKEEACSLTAQNCRRASLVNVDIVQGAAPPALAGLPAPDAVFVGGSGGKLREIIAAVYEKNASCPVLVAAVTLETLTEARSEAARAGKKCSVSQLSLAESRPVGSLSLMQAQNPVWLILLEP